MVSLPSITGFESALPIIERGQTLRLIHDSRQSRHIWPFWLSWIQQSILVAFISEIIGCTREGVYAVNVFAIVPGDQQRTDWKILVMVARDTFAISEGIGHTALP